MTASPEFEDWKARALAVDIVDAANARGAKLKRSGHEWVGPCPACGGEDRFSVHSGKRVFMCRGSVAGDVIAMVQHIEAVDFMAAVESLTGEAPPRGPSEARDPEVERERREEVRDREIGRAAEEQALRERKLTDAERLWESCGPIHGTHADAYLRRRGIALGRAQAVNLRFHPALAYEGYVDKEAQETAPLGIYPAMAAAIRDVAGTLIGVHRTYLDAAEPRKLVAPGDRRRNRAKKVYGAARGGAIWLGPVGAAVAAAEGIETALSWYALCVGPEEVTPVAAYSLGNLAGQATGTFPHPTIPKRTIPNGEPDPGKPGMILPPTVTDLTLLGDGDSDPPFTLASLMTAARRHRAAGVKVGLHLAPDGPDGRGRDWNDVWLAEGADA